MVKFAFTHSASFFMLFPTFYMHFWFIKCQKSEGIIGSDTFDPGIIIFVKKTHIKSRKCMEKF